MTLVLSPLASVKPETVEVRLSEVVGLAGEREAEVIDGAVLFMAAILIKLVLK